MNKPETEFQVVPEVWGWQSVGFPGDLCQWSSCTLSSLSEQTTIFSKKNN